MDLLSRRNDLALDFAQADEKKKRACETGRKGAGGVSFLKTKVAIETVSRGIPEQRVIHSMIVSNYSLHTSDR